MIDKKQKIILIGIVTTLIGGVSGNYFYTQAQIDNFKNDLIVHNIKDETADGIANYFKGNKDYLTWEEYNEYVNLINKLKNENSIKNLGDVKSKKDLIKKFNYIITESAKLKQIETVK